MKRSASEPGLKKPKLLSYQVYNVYHSKDCTPFCFPEFKSCTVSTRSAENGLGHGTYGNKLIEYSNYILLQVYSLTLQV